MRWCDRQQSADEFIWVGVAVRGRKLNNLLIPNGMHCSLVDSRHNYESVLNTAATGRRWRNIVGDLLTQPKLSQISKTKGAGIIFHTFVDCAKHWKMYGLENLCHQLLTVSYKFKRAAFWSNSWEFLYLQWTWKHNLSFYHLTKCSVEKIWNIRMRIYNMNQNKFSNKNILGIF